MYVDNSGNVFVPASTLFSDPVPETSCKVQGVTEDFSVGGVDAPAEKVVRVEEDEPIKHNPKSFISARTLFPDIDPPMWNFTSQSPEAVHEATHSVNKAAPADTSDPVLVPPSECAVAPVSTSGLPPNVPVRAIPTAAHVAYTASTMCVIQAICFTYLKVLMPSLYLGQPLMKIHSLFSQLHLYLVWQQLMARTRMAMNRNKQKYAFIYEVPYVYRLKLYFCLCYLGVLLIRGCLCLRMGYSLCFIAVACPSYMQCFIFYGPSYVFIFRTICVCDCDVTA